MVRVPLGVWQQIPQVRDMIERAAQRLAPAPIPGVRHAARRRHHGRSVSAQGLKSAFETPILSTHPTTPSRPANPSC